MPHKIHVLVKYAPDLDRAVVTLPKQQEVARTANTIARRLYPVSAVPEMIRPCRRTDLRAGLAADALGIVGNIEDGAKQ